MCKYRFILLLYMEIFCTLHRTIFNNDILTSKVVDLEEFSDSDSIQYFLTPTPTLTPPI